MFERGDWVTPTLGGFHWFEKPALLYWLQIAAYSLFGVSEFSARLGSALFGLGTIGGLWILGRSVDRAGDFANWLALISASSIGLIVFSRGASFDIMLTFPITAAMVCFFVHDLASNLDDRRSNAIAPLFGFYFFIGVALLAKGLVGIVFPFAIVGCYLLISRRSPSRVFLTSLVWGTAIAAAVAATWYLPMYLRNGWEFIDEFFIQHHFQRYTSNKYLHPQPFYFFLWVLPLMTVPWLPFFLLGVWKFGRRLFYRRDAETRRIDDQVGTDATIGTEIPVRQYSVSSSLLTFSAAWLLVPLAFFSFSGSKLPGYILPAVPPALIIASVWVAGFVGKGGWRPGLAKALAMTTFALVVGVILFALPRFADADSVKALIAAADARGMKNEKVMTLHTVSHNAEFYAAGRLVRDNDGRQIRFLGPADVVDQIRRSESGAVLVLTPLEYLRQLTESPLLLAEVLDDNDELAIIHVRLR